MRIAFIRAVNFKSLVDFELSVPKFSCLIGLNGAGKSSILHFLDFVAQQVRGDIKGWLSERSWRAKELSSRLLTKKNIEFEIRLVTDDGGSVNWTASFNPASLACTAEHIETPWATLDVEKGRIRVVAKVEQGAERRVMDEAISFSYEGSVLSQLKPERLPMSLTKFRFYIQSITSLDLLSPELLRQRTREASGEIGLGGQRLSAFLFELGSAKRHAIAGELRKAYRQVSAIQSTSLRSGWKQIEIIEKFGKHSLRTEARHINDGMLRLIAILAELETTNRFLLFDEIENGVNPELVEFIIDRLVNTKHQVLVTTHSPLVLNFIADEKAKEGVIYVYKTNSGATKAIPFFDIPSLAEKLKFMGPGEAFVDTDLLALAEEIGQQEKEEASVFPVKR